MIAYFFMSKPYKSGRPNKLKWVLEFAPKWKLVTRICACSSPYSDQKQKLNPYPLKTLENLWFSDVSRE